jgi:hypothetical protein
LAILMRQREIVATDFGFGPLGFRLA